MLSMQIIHDLEEQYLGLGLLKMTSGFSEKIKEVAVTGKADS